MGDEPAEYLKNCLDSTDEQGLEYFHQLKKSGKPGLPLILSAPKLSNSLAIMPPDRAEYGHRRGTDVRDRAYPETQGKHDKVFLEKYTTGYPQLKSI